MDLARIAIVLCGAVKLHFVTGPRDCYAVERGEVLKPQQTSLNCWQFAYNPHVLLHDSQDFAAA